jgi:hypothetical protein
MYGKVVPLRGDVKLICSNVTRDWNGGGLWRWTGKSGKTAFDIAPQPAFTHSEAPRFKRLA